MSLDTLSSSYLGHLDQLSLCLDRLGRFPYLLVLQCKKAKGSLKHTHIQL